MSRRVLIVDDHAAFRTAARELLERAGFDVVGEAANGAAALDANDRLRPGIVLLDISLPGMDGFEVAAQLAEREGAPAVVLTSSRDSGAYRHRLATSPAVGFVAKADLSAAALAAMLG